MSMHSTRSRRVRTLAITVGVLVGMTAGAYSSAAHAARHHAKPKPKPVVAEKFEPLPEATPEQLEAARRVLIGRYQCEFDKTLLIDANDTNRGYFNLRLGKQSWVVKPTVSSTGAIRMEDARNSVLVIQILTKSMLMDVKTGHRLVDDCVHEVQKAAQAELSKQPPHPSMLGDNTAPAGQ